MKKIILSAMILTLLPAAAFAQMDWLKKQADNLKSNSTAGITSTKLSDTKIGAGLKEALKVGLKNAVESTGKTGGFLNNEKIKILLPEKLRNVEKALRSVGLGKQIDEFVLSMNSAAESAAPLASDIFASALTDMSIDDAKAILSGGDNAATTYFKDKTKTKLESAFRPVIQKTLDQYGISKKYNDLIGRAKTVPFAKNLPNLDADQYVVSKTLDGLFTVLAQEEAKIRQDPAARVTSLLKEVFQ